MSVWLVTKNHMQCSQQPFILIYINLLTNLFMGMCHSTCISQFFPSTMAPKDETRSSGLAEVSLSTMPLLDYSIPREFLGVTDPRCYTQAWKIKLFSCFGLLRPQPCCVASMTSQMLGFQCVLPRVTPNYLLQLNRSDSTFSAM